MSADGKNDDYSITFYKLKDFNNVFGYSVSVMLLASKGFQEHIIEVEESKDRMEKEMLEKIRKLEKELENANDLLSATKRKGMG